MGNWRNTRFGRSKSLIAGSADAMSQYPRGMPVTIFSVSLRPRPRLFLSYHHKMSLVQGEDTESDEEIDTDQVHDASGRADKGKKVVPRAGLVTGEDSEEEDGKQR